MTFDERQLVGGFNQQVEFVQKLRFGGERCLCVGCKWRKADAAASTAAAASAAAGTAAAVVAASAVASLTGSSAAASTSRVLQLATADRWVRDGEEGAWLTAKSRQGCGSGNTVAANGLTQQFEEVPGTLGRGNRLICEDSSCIGALCRGGGPSVLGVESKVLHDPWYQELWKC